MISVSKRDFDRKVTRSSMAAASMDQINTKLQHNPDLFPKVLIIISK